MLWQMLVPSVDLGFLPSFLSVDDPRPAAEQFQAKYQGGWHPFKGPFKLLPNNALKYPGDPALLPLARTVLRNETIVLYPCDWVAVIQPDRSFEVCRMS